MKKTSISQVPVGATMFTKRGRKFKREGVVESITKNVPDRSVTVRFVGEPSGMTMNWACKVFFKSDS